ncbi:MAG: 50S ribosomal protein L13 [Spirochaetota bacterium]
MSLQKTYSMKAGEIEKRWFIIDAEGKILGRIATKIADILRGKHKPSFTAHLDMGDNIVVINAEKIVLSGTKEEDKQYYSHSHYPGGIKFRSIKKIRAEKPEYILEHAVKGMLPKSKLGKQLFTNLKIYKGAKHPHQAQKPEKLEV